MARSTDRIAYERSLFLSLVRRASEKKNNNKITASKNEISAARENCGCVSAARMRVCFLLARETKLGKRDCSKKNANRTGSLTFLCEAGLFIFP